MSYYKKVLIISDNQIICKDFKEIIQTIETTKFDFSTSPFSDHREFQQVLNQQVFAFDLREEDNVNHIISTYDLVISVHCKQLFPKKMVKGVKCINIHPGYNPINRGWYPQVFAIVHDLPLGATIHEIDEQLDHGKIIDREFIAVESYDVSSDVYQKILKKEVELIKRNIHKILDNTYTTIEPESEGNLFLKKDFNALMKIDLDEKVTFRQAINRLRGLTHGNFNNAYFIDDKGNKVYVRIHLEIDNKRK